MLRKWGLRLAFATALLAGSLLVLRLSGFETSIALQRAYSAVVSEGGVLIERGAEYGPHRRHKLDIYRPQTGEGTGPIAVFLYGGGWKRGSRETYGFVGAALASRGITTVIPDYRLYPEVSFPAFVEDAALAYAWIWRHLATGKEGSRPIILFGHSAGAHIAALLALDPNYLKTANSKARRPAAFIGLAGPYAFDPTTWPSTKEIFTAVANADRARPISFAGKEAPPSLLIHGLDDTVVRLWNTRSMTKALNAAGAKSRKIEYAGIGHIGLLVAISRPFRWRAPVLQEVVDFIRTVTNQRP